MNNPVNATARLFRTAPLSEKSGFFLGTCFAYRSPLYMVTAAHCVGQLSTDSLIVVFEDRRIAPVAEVIVHPTADLAILKLEQSHTSSSADFFKRTSRDLAMGMNFFAYGYPEIDAGRRIPPRVFSGTFQRFFDHESHMRRGGHSNAPRYRYVAGELSTPCPGGLSGGPVFRPEYPDVVLAVVTENVEAMTLLQAIEETQEDGKHFRTEYNRVLTYGVSLLLGHIADWLDQETPRAE